MRYWDGLHLRCNECGRSVITLKPEQTMTTVARVWIGHQLECPAEVTGGADARQSAVDA